MGGGAMDGQLVGVIGGIALLVIWYLVIWPAIKRGMGSAASAAGEALRPKADSAETILLATAKARKVLDGHVGVYADDWEKIDLGVRSGVENQMMVVAFSVTLLNIAVQDVAYDTGAVDRTMLMEGRNGFPKVKISDDAFRAALRDLWSRFTPATRANLDMRYRYIFTQRLAADNEATFFQRLSDYATRTLTDEMAYGAPPNRDWLEFLNDLADGNLDRARDFLDRIA